LTLRAGIAGLLGAVVAFGLASAEAVAVTAKSSEYEMGGIPIILAALGFIPLAAGIVAGLAVPARPYPAALVAWGLLLLTSIVLSSIPELHLGAETYLFPAGLNVLFVLWGALLADPSPRRLRTLRDGTLPLAGLMSFLAAIPIADVYFPGKTAWLPLAALVGFFIWLGVRNQRAGR
jgi:hypothetical protein